MITHMAENGCTLNEIQAQSGHKDVSVLLGYIQHTPQRIRKAYDRVFDDNHDYSPEPKVNVPGIDDSEYYKKMAFQRYLKEEISTETLNTMLHAFEDKEKTHSKPHPQNKDLAYM